MFTSIKANKIIGLTVITINDGKNISTVKEVIYDGIANQVKAIVVDEKGWFKSAKIIMIEDIQSIGEDAIIVADESVIVDSGDQNDNVVTTIVDDNNFLTKNEVVTSSGKKLGRVTDIYFNFPGGKVDAIEVSEGFLKNIGSGSKKIFITDVVTIGENNLIVKDIAEATFEEQGKDQGMNKVIADTKENVGNFTEAAVVKSQETFEAAKHTTADIAHKVSDKTQEVVNSDQVQSAIHKTQEVATNVKDTVIDKFDETKEYVQSGNLKEDSQQKFAELKSQTENFVNAAKEKTEGVLNDSKTNLVDVTDTAKVAMLDKRIQDSIGKTVGDIILLSKSDTIMAQTGDIVTHSLVNQAKIEGNLEKLLDNLVSV